MSRRRALIVIAALWTASAALGSAHVETFDLRGTVRAGGRPEADAVVWLDAPTAAPPRAEKQAVLDQRNLNFFPRVLAVRVGTVVDVPNNDRVFHNVFSFHDGKRFDLGLYPVGTTRHVHFDTAGVSRVFCNIHPNMAAYVKAVDTPYFAVSDRTGRFSIAALREGTYTWHAWRPGRQDLTGSAVFNPDSVLDLQWR